MPVRTLPRVSLQEEARLYGRELESLVSAVGNTAPLPRRRTQ